MTYQGTYRLWRQLFSCTATELTSTNIPNSLTQHFPMRPNHRKVISWYNIRLAQPQWQPAYLSMQFQIFKLEKDLANILQSNAERVRYLDVYDKMTVQGRLLYHKLTTDGWIKSWVTLIQFSDTAAKLSDKFDWLKYLQESFSLVDIAVEPDMEIVSYGSKYFKSMMNVLGKYNAS